MVKFQSGQSTEDGLKNWTVYKSRQPWKWMILKFKISLMSKNWTSFEHEQFGRLSISARLFTFDGLSTLPDQSILAGRSLSIDRRCHWTAHLELLPKFIKMDFWELLILIPVTILILPYSELIWKSLLRNTCAHHWIFIWHHIVREERNHVSDAIHLILNEKLGVLQNVFPTNSWSMTNVASQTSGKFVTKVNLTFVTFSL